MGCLKVTFCAAKGDTDLLLRADFARLCLTYGDGERALRAGLRPMWERFGLAGRDVERRPFEGGGEFGRVGPGEGAVVAGVASLGVPAN